MGGLNSSGSSSALLIARVVRGGSLNNENIYIIKCCNFYGVCVLTGFFGFVVCFFLIHSVFKEHHVIIAANDTVPTAINTTEQIGDEVTLHYKVRNH